MADNNGWGRPESSGWGAGSGDSADDSADETRIFGADGPARGSEQPQQPQQPQQPEPPQYQRPEQPEQPAWGQPGPGPTPWAAGAGQSPYPPGPPPQQPQYSPYQGDPQYQQYPQYPQEDDKSSGGGRLFFIIAIPLLIIILVAALLVWKWDDFFGSDDSASQGVPTAPQQPGTAPDAAPDADADADEDEDADSDQDQGRPRDPDLPDDVVPVNAAARNNEPAGDFNNIYTSPPGTSSYTSPEFAEAVRDAFVDAYLDSDDGETNHVLDVRSPVTGDTYQMTCDDNGKYIHCHGGNDANVYIA